MTTALRRFPLALAAVLSMALLSACDGENCFTANCDGGGTPTDTTTNPVVADTVAPEARVQLPLDSATVAVGDSIFVQVRLTDDVGLGVVTLSGFSLRGDPNLGTQQKVERFVAKDIDLSPRTTGRLVRDTVITRFLLASTDSTPERGVYVVALARDTIGRTDADTVPVVIGGPKIQILSPAAATEFRAGTQIPVRLLAEDRIDLISSIRLRTTGAFASDTTLLLRVPRASVDTTVVLFLPNVGQGALLVEAGTTSGSRLTGSARPVAVTVLPPITDQLPPRLSYTMEVPTRAETLDTLSVTLSASDETRVDSVGASVFAIRRTATGEDTLAAIRRKLAGPAGTVKFAIEEFSTAALPFNGLDTVTIAFEVTAFAKDPAGNCATATAPGAVQSSPCRTGPAGTIVSDGPGRLQNVLITRGLTVPPPNSGDVLADLVADQARLFISNRTRNRVEVLPVGSRSYLAPVRVGSEPWGLAVGNSGDSLYVSNSGGTNLSVIPLRDAVLAEAEDKRLFPPNERLFRALLNGINNVDRVVAVDFSDRPQFVQQASNGLLVYSTKPTTAAQSGTVRIYNPRKLRSEIFVGYGAFTADDEALIVNAASAGLTVIRTDTSDTPIEGLTVCPRATHGAAAPPCITDDYLTVVDSVNGLYGQPTGLGGVYDAQIFPNLNIETIGLSDTTFVAASGNHDFIAVGEGARRNARLPTFQVSGPDDLTLVGDVVDLIGNTAERIIGVSLNLDGSLGIARGDQAYFFTERLRLQGVVESGAPTGGVAMHPGNFGYPNGPNRLAFVSGVDGSGPYVDVIDTFNFFRISRLYVRDPVVGALAVAPRAAADPGNVVLRLYALTPRGIVSLQVTTADLQR